MDALSELLRAVRLSASIYAAWEFNAPWGVDFPGARFATFHFVERGTCWIVDSVNRSLRIDEGDLVVVFSGRHRLADRRTREAISLRQLLETHGTPTEVHRYGGGGAATHVVCGKFAVEELEGRARAFEAFPPVWRIPAREASHSALDQTLRALGKETRAARPGWELVATRLTEALFVHVMRDLVERKEADLGWLNALRDPQISSALGHIHREPGKHWTVGSLAAAVGLSRTVFAARFAELIGLTPIQYVSRWRASLAARWLRETDRAIAEIAASLGYSSAAAFHRAFRREIGDSPGAVHRKARSADRAMGISQDPLP